MTKKAKARFILKVANPSPEGPRWFNVGKASEVDGEHGRMLVGNLTHVPLFMLQQGDAFKNWDGGFILTEVDKEKE